MTGERLLQEKRTGGGEPAAAIGAAWWGVFPQWGTDLVTGGQGATDGTVWWSHFYRFPRITKSSGLQQFLSICSPSCTWSFSWLHVLIQPNLQSPLQVSNPLAFLCCKTQEPDDWDRKCPLWLTLSSTHTHTYLIILPHGTITKTRIHQSYWTYGTSKNAALTQTFCTVKMDWTERKQLWVRNSPLFTRGVLGAK